MSISCHKNGLWCRGTPEYVFMSTNMNFVHFLKENISSVVFSTEISLKKVFFQILRWDFFLHCGPKYAPYDQIIEMNIVPLDQGNRLVVIRASHDTTVRFYDRKLTFLSFVRKSSLEIDWNFAGFLCFSEIQNTQNSAPATEKLVGDMKKRLPLWGGLNWYSIQQKKNQANISYRLGCGRKSSLRCENAYLRL